MGDVASLLPTMLTQAGKGRLARKHGIFFKFESNWKGLFRPGFVSNASDFDHIPLGM
jgi:hypothetical protein